MENKKFNKEIYEGIKKEGKYQDQYYDYIVINKNMIFKSWKTSYFTSKKYEFFGIIDTNKKDVFTEENIETVQNELIEEAKKRTLEEIIENESKYINIQKNVFDEKLKNEDFKRSLLYNNNATNERFNNYYVIGKTPAEYKKELLNHIIKTEKEFTNEAFFEKYATEESEEIIEQIKGLITDDQYLDKWDFDYKWNNGTPESQKITCTFKNKISLELNKINLFVNEYSKTFTKPDQTLQKSKNLYEICKTFKEENQNKTCNLYLQNDEKLKVIDFDYLLYIFESGKNEAFTYRLLTTSDRNKLEKYNEETKNKKREDNIFIQDIKKLEFGKKVIFEEI